MSSAFPARSPALSSAGAAVSAPVSPLYGSPLTWSEQERDEFRALIRQKKQQEEEEAAAAAAADRRRPLVQVGYSPRHTAAAGASSRGFPSPRVQQHPYPSPLPRQPAAFPAPLHSSPAATAPAPRLVRGLGRGRPLHAQSPAQQLLPRVPPPPLQQPRSSALPLPFSEADADAEWMMDPDARPRNGARRAQKQQQRQRAQQEQDEEAEEGEGEYERERRPPRRAARPSEDAPLLLAPRQSRVDAAPLPMPLPLPQVHESTMQDELQYEDEMQQQHEQPPQEPEHEHQLQPAPESEPQPLDLGFVPAPSRPPVVRSGELLMAQLMGDEAEIARIRAREQKEAEEAAAAAAASVSAVAPRDSGWPGQPQTKGSQVAILCAEVERAREATDADPWERLKCLPPDPLPAPESPTPRGLCALQHRQWITPTSQPFVSDAPAPSSAARLRAQFASLDSQAVVEELSANGIALPEDARRPVLYTDDVAVPQDRPRKDPKPSPKPEPSGDPEKRQRAPRASSRSSSGGSCGSGGSEGGRKTGGRSSSASREQPSTPSVGASTSDPVSATPRSTVGAHDHGRMYSSFAKPDGPNFSSLINEQQALIRSEREKGAASAAARRRPQQPKKMEVEESSDDENRPIRSINDAQPESFSFPVASRSAAPNRPFKPPQSSGTAASGAVSASLSAPAPGLTRPVMSAVGPASDLCPLRFFPPSFLRYFFRTQGGRPPAALAASIDAESMSIPKVGEAGAQAGELLHTTAIFSSLASYEEYWTRQLCLLLQGHVNRVSVPFARAVSILLANRPSGGLHSTLSPEQIHQAARLQHVHFYGSHVLSLEIVDKTTIWKKNNSNKFKSNTWGKGKKRGRKGAAAEDDEGDEEEDAGPSVPAGDLIPYLTLLSTDAKERRSSASGQSGCSEGDLWILSSDAQFDLGIGAETKVNSSESAWFSRPVAPNKFVVFAVAVWHNFSADKQKLRLMPLPLGPSNANTKFFSKPLKPTKVNAIRIGDCDEPALRLLNGLIPAAIPGDPPVTALKSFPLLPYILHGAYWKRFREKYHPREGWMSERERMEEARRQSQAKIQSKLHFNRSRDGEAAAASSSAASAALFEPLVDAVVNLIPSVPISPSLLRSVKSSIESQFTLNADQQSVLDAVAGWFWLKREAAEEADSGMSDDESASAAASSEAQKPTTEPIQLVHGCFGSGKSYLLTALITFLVRLLDKADPECKIKILVAGLTNVAVDGILILLQSLSIPFVRVGSIRRVAPPILAHMVHMSTGADGKNTQLSSEKTALHDLEALLAAHDAARVPGASAALPDPMERIHLENAIAMVKAEKGHRRSLRLKNARVVGITTAACGFEIMHDKDLGLRYPIVFLDEASQQTEPSSLIPLNFKAERLLAVGDPLQLAPTLPNLDSSLGAVTQKVGPIEEKTGLTRTLFVRLQQAGMPTMKLRTQYRCHPDVADIPSRLFYNGSLTSGVSAESRAPMLVAMPGSAYSAPLPPLMFIDVPQGVEFSQQFSGSISNAFEADAIVQLIQTLLILGMLPSQIGVILPYHAQATLVKSKLESVSVIPKSRQPQPTYKLPVSGKGHGAQAAMALAVPLADGERVSAAGIQVATVDSFQGAEKPIIILGTVRTTEPSFINEPTRLNVSLTRAKNHLFILGKSMMLKQDEKFQTILATARTKPGWYQPNPKAAQDRLDKLTINEALLVPREVDEAAMASDVSTRELAWQMQHAPRGRQSKKAKHLASDTASSAAAAAASDQDDWLDDDSSEEEEEAVANEADAEKQGEDDEDEEEAGDDDLEGLSPYSRQQAAAAEKSHEAVPSSSSNVAAPAAASTASSAMDLDTFLAKQRAKDAKRRAAQEARDAQRRPDSESSDGEMDIMDLPRQPQQRQEPPSSQSAASSSEDEPISRMQAAHRAIPFSPYHPNSVRGALARSRANSSSSEASSQ